ncbi:MAG: hypothetical protein D6698_06770 [Gammaproteobacteria bacterium]|nr:MAG: hypothetical protein D6698_06770 [Gammaproteobacteria bacterium]
MPKKSQTKKQNPYSHLFGKKISLNLKRESFFFCGDIHLSPERWWATISPGWPDEYYQMILRAISDGHIVYGKERIEPVDRDDEVLDNWWNLVRINGASDIVVAALKKLVKEGSDKGYSLEEIATHCLAQENTSLNRPEVKKLLESALTYVDRRLGSISEVTEEEGKNPRIDILTTPDGSVIVRREE